MNDTRELEDLLSSALRLINHELDVIRVAIDTIDHISELLETKLLRLKSCE